LGELSWAFDVRHRGARRAYLRVCAQSVEDYLGKRSSLGNGEDFNVFFAWFLPCPTNIITGRGASQLLCVSPDHVLGLIDSGCLVGTGARRGPKGSPVVQVESLKAFLQDRRWSG
jgi:hypothetical protein